MGSVLYMERNCPVCNSSDLYIDENTQELVCRKCGTVIDSGIDYAAEHIRKDIQREEIDTLAPKNYGGVRYSEPEKRAYPGYNQDLAKNETVRDIYSWWSKATVNGKTTGVLNTLEEIKKYLNLPDSVYEDAVILYWRYKEATLKKPPVEGLLRACIYISARKYKIPIFLSEIRDVGDVEWDGKRRFVRLINTILKTLKIKLPPIPISAYINRFLDMLQITPKYEVYKKALSLYRRLNKNKEVSIFLSNTRPTIVALALINIALLRVKNEKLTPNQVMYAGVSQNSFYKAVNYLSNHLPE